MDCHFGGIAEHEAADSQQASCLNPAQRPRRPGAPAPRPRRRWDAAEIAEGLALVDAAFRGLPTDALPGSYLLQAAIAACHARSASPAATPWGEIAALHGILEAVAPGPVVQLNRAVAVAMAEGPAAGLVLVEALGIAGALAEYQHFHATHGDLLRRLGRRRESAAAYERALALVTNEAERVFLARRLAEVRAAG